MINKYTVTFALSIAATIYYIVPAIKAATGL